MPLVMSQRHSCHSDEGKRICGIKIKNATPEDSGIYSLVIENPYGADDSSCQVLVQSPRQRAMSTDNIPYSPAPTEHGPTPQRFDEGTCLNAIPPKFVLGLPPNKQVNEGEPLSLTCQVQGSPMPNIIWLKDGNPLPTSLRYSTDYNPDTGVCKLNVSGPLTSDSGNYTCVAENPAGKAYTTTQGVVKNTNKYDSQDDSQSDSEVPLNRAKPPKVIHGLRDIKEVEGNPVSMACKIDGFPKPTLTWLKNGQPIVASNRLNTEYNLNTGVAKLKINDTVLTDAGVYSVLAENKAGSDQTNGRLDIIKDTGIDDKPIFNYPPHSVRARAPSPQMPATMRGPSPALRSVPDVTYVPPDDEGRAYEPPKVIIPLKDIKVQEGPAVNFMCKIIGFPIPTITWKHNNNPIHDSSRYTTNYDHTTGIASFKINGTQINDPGTYTAIASNPAGSADTTAKLTLTPVSLIDTNPIVNPDAFR